MLARRLRRSLIAGLALVVAMLCGSSAWAESVASLKKKLKDSDFRVRTQAALALGASGSKSAVNPLCSALKDGNDTVRAASAAALGRLAKGGKSCLSKRKKVEKDKNVLKMINKALRILDESSGGPTLSSSSKHYVAVLPPKVQADRSKEVTALIRKIFQRGAAKSRGLVVAPSGESTNQAKKRLRKYPHVLGWALQPKVEVRYDGSHLVVRLEMDIFDYPSKQPQGSLMQRAGSGGISGKAPDVEDDLVAKVSKAAFEQFVNMAEQVN